MSELLDEFLNQERKSRCIVCAHKEVADIILSHLNKLLHGETTITLRVVHSGLLLPKFNSPKAMDTVYKHVRQCLGRDPKDGMTL